MVVYSVHVGWEQPGLQVPALVGSDSEHVLIWNEMGHGTSPFH